MRGILLITEDLRGVNAVQSSLVREGYRVALCAPDDDSILQTAGKLTPEVIIVDSRESAEQAVRCRRLLRTECNLKELLTVALITPEQAAGMEWAGIDDFVLHPCDGEEVVHRLKFLLFRTRNINNDQVLRVGDLMIDLLNYDVTVGGEPVELTFKEYELLKFLATHRGRVFTRESLLDHVWGYDYYGGTRTVDVHIRRLRAKLGPDCEPLIETVRNVGYRFTS